MTRQQEIRSRCGLEGSWERTFCGKLFKLVVLQNGAQSSVS